MKGKNIVCLREIVEQLSELRIATPINDPFYEKIKILYQGASNLLAEIIEKEIDEER
jgi:hypothetical protein